MTRLYPSVPTLLANALYEEFGAGSTKLPYPLDLPAVQVTRQGGGDNTVTDSARIEVIVIAGSEDEAENLAERIRMWLTTEQPIEHGGRMLDRVTTEVGPRRVPFPDDQQSGVTEYVASYVATARAQ